MIGPALDGTPSLFSVAFDLGSVGYAVHEHFVTGTASAYREVGERGPDGHWVAQRSLEAEFTTRIVVHQPAEPSRANGTVVVEWLNVTGGLDIPALWMPTHRHLIRDGYTWVGVSVQQVGIDGGGMNPGLGLHQMAPDRYEPLRHPGDAYAFDMFTQIGLTLRDALPERFGVRGDRLLAAGASQSAFHLTTYLNAIDPAERVFDGFLLQGRAGRGVPIAGMEPVIAGPEIDAAARRARLTGNDHIRDDGRAPVLVVQSETDVFGMLGYLPARQADSDRFRLWEVAGAAHCDSYFLCAAPHDSGDVGVEALAEMITHPDRVAIPTAVPINSGPQMHYVLQRAFDALNEWMRQGTPPPTSPRLETDGESLAIDELGVARGGLRTPWVDAPASVLSGLVQTGDMGELFGCTRAFSAATLAVRYPGGRDDYVAEFRDATRASVEAGYLLEIDASEIEKLGALTWPES